jgi:hypothetical protein
MRLPISKRLDIVPPNVVIVYRTILMGGMVTTFSLFTFCDLYRFESIPNVVNFLGITSSWEACKFDIHFRHESCIYYRIKLRKSVFSLDG